jgi:uridine kinase
MKFLSLRDVIREVERYAHERRTSLLIALDGRSGAGKSTVSDKIASRIGAVVVSSDDFYTGGTFDDWASRSPQEKAALCIDWKRLRTDVLEPLLSGNSATWRSFDWKTWEGLSEHTFSCKPASIIIIDGVYSTRPELADLIDISILVRLPDRIRLERVRNREKEPFLARWHAVWDEAEEYYFTNIRPPSSFDLVLVRR